MQRIRKYGNTIIFCLFAVCLMGGGDIATSDTEADSRIPGLTEVHIAPNGVVMPLGRILLVRHESVYCAVKFIEFWTGETEDDRYARYESYYRTDKTSDFTNKNTKTIREELHDPKAKWSLFGHPVAADAKKEIKCGPVRLWWTGKGAVYFFKRYQKQGDYGIELAPTPWTDISQVNVFDQRIKWYKYDEKRKRENIPIDKLWEDKDKEKGAK